MSVKLPIDKDLSLKIGDSFHFSFTISDSSGYTITARDLTGYTGVGQIRLKSDPTSALIADMTFSSDAQDLLDGKIVMTIDAATSATLEAGTYFYDIYIDNGAGIVRTYFSGKFVISVRTSA
jgi:hypothetical protein